VSKLDLRVEIDNRIRATNRLAADDVTEEEVSTLSRQIMAWLACDSVQMAIMGGTILRNAIRESNNPEDAINIEKRAWLESSYFASTLTAGLAAVRRLSFLLSQYEDMVKTESTQLWTGKRKGGSPDVDADPAAEDGG
jgi:hypothetical protein